jgi:hypothetical protein
VGSNVPFFDDTMHSLVNVDAGMFKDASLMGIFPLPPLSSTTDISPINMTSSYTIGSRRSIDPWVVSHPNDVESSRTTMSLTSVEIIDLEIPLASVDIGHQLHPHMECDHPTLPIWVVDFPSLHDILDSELPSDEAILEVIASIDNPREGENHQESMLPNLELMRIYIMSFDLGLGTLTGTSSETPSLDLVPHWLSFSELATELSATPSIEYSCFVLPSCLDGFHQGASLTCETTHNEYLRMHKCIPMWHGPDKVSHMMPTLAHQFIDYEKDHWNEPSHGLYFA